ncbi:MAG: M20/M25/M40 family metallo-hydrolase [Parcubacteria group bacterium]|nr:M20/M25/M40 family metallo-hydrolase [Parcubacteria group bacterium]
MKPHISKEQFLDDLSQSMRFPTIAGNISAQHNCLHWVKKRFGEGLHSVYLEHEGQPSLILSGRPSTHFKILLCGHLDVVPAAAEQFKLQIENDKVYGRGVFDMKGPLLAAMYPFINFIKSHPDKDVGILLTTDEEIDGTKGVKAILDKGYSTDIVIIPDGGSNFEVITMQKGVFQFSVSFYGASAHSSRPWEGGGAVGRMTTFLEMLSQHYPVPAAPTPSTTCALTLIEGGSARNSMPEKIKITYDCRFSSVAKLQELKSLIVANLSSRDKLDVLLETPVFEADTANTLFQEAARGIQEAIGRKISYTYEYGSSDALYFHSRSIPVLIVRPLGGDSHGKNEWLDVNSALLFSDALGGALKYILDK